ncbi:MAG: toll/interleukin-1 receptor domain-containing protein [Planctomycetota bacterium]|jgi:hypothetical protein
MLDSRILDRARRLIQIGFEERRKIFQGEIAQIREKMLSGGVRSGAFLVKIHDTCTQEVAIRAKIVLENIMRAHKALGSPLTGTLAADIKEEGSHFIERITEEVSEKMAHEMHFMQREAQHYNLSGAKHGATQEMNIEAELYVDSLAVESKNLGSVNTGAKTIFISHAAEDAIFAKIVKTQIDNVFEKKVNVFVSSIPGTISPGSEWLEKIIGNLTENNAFLVLVTPYSKKRPFVWFEIGFSWLRRLNKNCEIYAICAPPIDPGNLPEPLCRLQATSLASEKQTKAFFAKLIRQFGLGDIDILQFSKISDSLPTYPPQNYTNGRKTTDDDLEFDPKTGTCVCKDDELRYCHKCLHSSPAKRVPLKEQDNGWRCSVCNAFYRNPNYNPPTHAINDYDPLAL